jgi:hypothetical protein
MGKEGSDPDLSVRKNTSVGFWLYQYSLENPRMLYSHRCMKSIVLDIGIVCELLKLVIYYPEPKMLR